MKPTLRSLTVALAAGLFCNMAAAQVATVNGKPIPSERMDLILAEQTAQGAPDSAELRAAVRNELIQREVLSQAAEKSGIANKPEVRTQAEIASQAILIRAYLQDFMAKNPVSDAEIQAEYNNVKKQFSGDEYKVHHILVEEADEAQKIIDQLRTGSDFAALAKQHSKDPGSVQSGGDLGWRNPNEFVPPFGEALKSLKKGAMTTRPVQTDFGYHVIQVEDTRKMTPPTLEEARPQIKNHLEELKLAQHLEELQSKAKIQ
ncbi:MAG TPA: peptidylprolyl isomerase [Azoarcus sp.]|nr:peptidylprolyl isomerase [Azoarcus sp.]